MMKILRNWLNPNPKQFLGTLNKEDAAEIRHFYFMNHKVDELKAHRRSHDGVKIAWRRTMFF